MITSIMLRFDKYYHDTPKAYLVRIGSSEHWLPKKLCRKFTLNAKLGGHVTVPAFLYERITGESIEDAPLGDADTIIEKHIPQPVAPVETEPHKELLK